MRGVILAGGSGTRLYPLTKIISKQLLPVYDKPMIYYPLSVLMMAGIREILVVCTAAECSNYKKLLGDGSRFGVQLLYKVQEKPNGIVDALLMGREFIGKEPCALVLGDNIFYGNELRSILRKAVEYVKKDAMLTFAYYVMEPQKFGVVEFDESGRAVSVEEKPEYPKSNYCMTGLYFFGENVVEMAQTVVPSERGELEIMDLARKYLEINKLQLQVLDKDIIWFDAGTVDGLMEASSFVQTVQKRQGKVICAPEAIACQEKWITGEQLLVYAEFYGKSLYGEYVRKVAGEKVQH